MISAVANESSFSMDLELRNDISCDFLDCRKMDICKIGGRSERDGWIR